MKVGLAGFNSAWSCCRDGEKGKLWLAGRWQVEELTDKLEGADLPIALVHHPEGWYVEHEAKQFWRHGIQQNFRFCVHGHEHDSWVETPNREHVTIAAAACYERSDKPNGYNIVRLDLDARQGEVWLHKYEPRGGGGWIPDVIPNRTDERGVWPIRLDWLGPPFVLSAGAAPTPAGNNPGALIDLQPYLNAIQKQVREGLTVGAVESVRSTVSHTATVTAHPDGPFTTVVNATLQVNVNVLVGVADARQGGVPEPAVAASGGSPDDADRLNQEIKDVAGMIGKGKPQFVLELLARIEARSADRLTVRNRFIIALNKGQAFQLMGEVKQAADMYLLARGYEVTEEKDVKNAAYFEAAAHDLRGDRPKAHELVQSLRSRLSPNEMPATTSLWLLTSDPDTPFGDLERSVPARRRTLGRSASPSPSVRPISACTMRRRSTLAARSPRNPSGWTRVRSSARSSSASSLARTSSTDSLGRPSPTGRTLKRSRGYSPMESTKLLRTRLLLVLRRCT